MVIQQYPRMRLRPTLLSSTVTDTQAPREILSAFVSITALPVNEQDVEETKEAEEVTDLSNSDVTTKYQEASKIANLALQGVVQQCVANARVNDLCKFGDTVIEQVR